VSSQWAYMVSQVDVAGFKRDEPNHHCKIAGIPMRECVLPAGVMEFVRYFGEGVLQPRIGIRRTVNTAMSVCDFMVAAVYQPPAFGEVTRVPVLPVYGFELGLVDQLFWNLVSGVER